ncbi:MAG: DUF4360 domain-containing protein [Oligoflexia bacterium]|nr:DUF4360 domain-containing protein [Oligoflexia bacterium]
MTNKMFAKFIILTFSLLMFGSLISCKKNPNSNTPVASLKVSITDGIAPLSIELDASRSYSPNGTIVSYNFNFGDGSSEISTNSKISHVYNTAGTFYASVTVTDDKSQTATSASYSIAVVDQGTGEISLGEPTYSGSGCPTGSLSTVLAPDNKSLSVLFDQFSVTAGVGSAVALERKECALSIPVHVPNGYSVSVYKLDYRGHAEIPLNGIPSAEGKLSVEYFFAGSQGITLSRSFVPGFSDDFTVTDNLAGTIDVWSNCGEDVILRTNTNITAKTNSLNETTMLTIDSVDITSGITFHLKYQTCL